MRAIIVILTAIGALAAGVGVGYAQSGAELVKAKGCMGCHDADKKKVGPAFKDIAAKHKGDKGAEASLVAKLKDGKGHPKAAASETEIKSAVQHVLSGK